MPNDFSDLLSWDAGDHIPESHYTRLQSHPHFAKSVITLARGMLVLSDSDKTLDGIFKDAGRYVAAMWAMYLHASGGLTVPRLKEICAASGLVSPGRARALLLYMRYLGYIVALPKQRRGDLAHYAPTEGFLDSWRDHLRAALEAAACIEPGVGSLLDRLDEPAVLERASCIQSEGLFAQARDGDRESPFVRVFLHPHAGSQIMWVLFVSGPENTFPSDEPVPFSIGAAAKRFGVSRTHIRRIIDAAVRENLIVYGEEGSVTFTQTAREALSRHFAAQILQLLITTARTLASFDDAGHASRPAQYAMVQEVA